MSWAKLCDTFWAHPKILAVGNEGAGAFARMLSYSACHLTDGVISADVARTITTPRVIRSLASAKLLENLGENSWKIHGFLERNPSRSTVETEREKTALRVAEHRATKRSAPGCNAVTPRVTTAVTTPVGNALGTPAPTRPDPTRGTTYPFTSPSGETSPKAKGRRSKGAPTPDPIPFPGTVARQVYDALTTDPVLGPIVAGPGDAATRWSDPSTYPGVDVAAEVRRAGEYAATKPGRYTDGRAFLRGWLQRKADEIARAPKVAPVRVEPAEEYDGGWGAAMRREQERLERLRAERKAAGGAP